MVSWLPGYRANRIFLRSIGAALAASRMKHLSRWLLMLLRFKSHWREIEAKFCELNQASIKRTGRSFRLTA
jgi:hypothetical protein